MPNEDPDRLKPVQRQALAQIYLSNPSEYSEKDKESYNKYIKSRNLNLLRCLIDNNNLTAIINQLALGYTKAAALNTAIEYANDTQIKAYLLDYRNSHFNIQKETSNKNRRLENALKW